MPRFDPTDFSRLLARLTPQELRKVEGMVAEALERAEAVLEIDARAEAGGPATSCPRCGGDKRSRWAKDTDRGTALALLGLRGDVVGPQRDAARPGASSRPHGRVGA